MTFIRSILATAILSSGIAALPAAAQSNATPTAAETQAARNRNLCNDPWVTIALERVTFGVNVARCSPSLYNGGRWNSFQELYAAVDTTIRTLSQQNADLRVVPVVGSRSQAIGVFLDNQLVAAGGGNLVAAGGGNLVAAGGGNLKINGNSLVAAGGGNFQDAPVASFGGGRTLMSGRSIRLPVGRIGAQ